jgi:hypothetical protein
LLIIGLGLAWRQPGRPSVRRRAALPLGLLAALVTFLVTTAVSRAAFGDEAARHSRYLHLVAALSIVAIAVAADAVARRWPVTIPAVLVVLLIGVPGNVDIVANHKGPGRESRPEKDLYLAAAHLDLPPTVPGWARPDPFLTPDLTLAWLQEGAADGRIPRPAEIAPSLAEVVRFRLSLQQIPEPVPFGACQPLTAPRAVRLEAGESFGFRGRQLIVALTDGPAGARLELDSRGGETVVAVAGPLDLSVRAASGTSARICGLGRTR